MHVFLRMDHFFNVQSSDIEIANRPSGEKFAQEIDSECPKKAFICFPDTTLNKYKPASSDDTNANGALWWKFNDVNSSPNPMCCPLNWAFIYWVRLVYIYATLKVSVFSERHC